MFRPSLLACLILLAAGAGKGHSDERTVAIERLHALREITYPGVRLELKDVDYGRLAAAIPPALELRRNASGLWLRVSSGAPDELRSGTLFDYLMTALATASVIAPTREGKQIWMRHRLDVVLQMLRDPYTRRAYFERKNAESHLSDYDYVVRIQMRELYQARFPMVREGFIPLTAWGLYQGFHWNDSPGTVLVDKHVVFVEQGALTAAGVPIRTLGLVATAISDRRRASIPVGDRADAGPRRGFRTADGKVYIPVEELDRQGLITVQAQREAQMVEISLEPPHRHPAAPAAPGS